MIQRHGNGYAKDAAHDRRTEAHHGDCRMEFQYGNRSVLVLVGMASVRDAIAHRKRLDVARIRGVIHNGVWSVSFPIL